MMLQSICSNGRRSPSSSIRVNEGLRVEGEACHKVEKGLGRYALESNEAKLSSPSCIPQAIAPRGNGLKRVEWQIHKTTNHGMYYCSWLILGGATSRRSSLYNRVLSSLECRLIGYSVAGVSDDVLFFLPISLLLSIFLFFSTLYLSSLAPPIYFLFELIL